MKPNKWSELTDDTKRMYAHNLMNTVRGKYIIAQALAVAVETMRMASYPEQSNIEDMEMLAEGLFEPFYGIIAFSRKTDAHRNSR